MIFNVFGEITQKYWDEIPHDISRGTARQFPFIRLDEMVVMPNHIHGILWIEKPDEIGDGTVVTPKSGVSTNKLSVSTNKNHHPEWKPEPLG